MPHKPDRVISTRGSAAPMELHPDAVSNDKSYKTTRSLPPLPQTTLSPILASLTAAPRRGDLPVVRSDINASKRTEQHSPPFKSASTAVESDNMMRTIDRPPPGDPMTRRKSQSSIHVQKQRSAYFQNEFAAPNRESNPVKSRIHNEAIVMAELRTNVIVKSHRCPGVR
jgi:hypothetical protein